MRWRRIGMSLKLTSLGFRLALSNDPQTLFGCFWTSTDDPM
jgi:hypothetical protein